MKNEINIEFIDEKNEYNYMSDLDDEIYEQEFNVKNPKIPDSLKTPELSQKKIMHIKKKSKLDNESQIDLMSDANIYSSRNSNILGSSFNNIEKVDYQLNKSKNFKKNKFKSGNLSNKSNNNKIITKNIYINK